MYSRFDTIREQEGPPIETQTVRGLAQEILPVSQLSRLAVDSDAKVVLIGEASHGTKEFYEYRSGLTKQLIEAGKCQAVLIEGDFPDTALLHWFVLGAGAEAPVEDRLSAFARFPTWMWDNDSMRDFLLWLRAHNLQRPMEDRVGMFGMDVYSLHLSMTKVLEYLQHTNDLDTLTKVQQDFSCFDKFGDDVQMYGLLTSRGYKGTCEKEVLHAVQTLSKALGDGKRGHDPESKTDDSKSAAGPPSVVAGGAGVPGVVQQDEAFCAEINAQVVADAERYYRAMFSKKESSWNIRDQHFCSVVERTREHLLATRGRGDVVCWAHNSHVGDARHTHLDMERDRRELNLGQLLKQSLGQQVLIVGQLTHAGAVMAADDWGGAHRCKAVLPALPSSHEDLLHVVSKRTGAAAYGLDMRSPVVAGLLGTEPRLQRAIGVIYRPETERQSHYYYCDIVRQFDLVHWVDATHPVVPLCRNEPAAVMPETYPTGL